MFRLFPTVGGVQGRYLCEGETVASDRAVSDKVDHKTQGLSVAGYPLPKYRRTSTEAVFPLPWVLWYALRWGDAPYIGYIDC